MDCGLDRRSLEICVQLVEHGCNPHSVAKVIQELRRENAGLDAREEAERQAALAQAQGRAQAQAQAQAQRLITQPRPRQVQQPPPQQQRRPQKGRR